MNRIIYLKFILSTNSYIYTSILYKSFEPYEVIDEVFIDENRLLEE